MAWTVYLLLQYLIWREECSAYITAYDILYKLDKFVEISANVYNFVDIFYIIQTFSEAIPILVPNVIVHLHLSKRSLRLGKWVHNFGSCRIFFKQKKSRFLRIFFFNNRKICFSSFNKCYNFKNVHYYNYSIIIYLCIIPYRNLRNKNIYSGPSVNERNSLCETFVKQIHYSHINQCKIK